MNLFKAILDTRHQNGVIGTITQFDNATLELQVVADGQVDEAWESPQFELVAMKRDMNVVREVEQDRFTILSKEDHTVQIDLKEQFLTCRGTVKMQLIVKDGSRLSTTLFYLSIGQSLDHDIVASYRDAKVLDDFDALNQQTYDDLAFREQRYSQMEESFTDMNSTMNANETERNKAEIIRQQAFDINEAHRTRTFNNQVEEQEMAFSDAQARRETSFSKSQQNMSQKFETSQEERESTFNKSQESNQNTFVTNEAKRQTSFDKSQSANQTEFNKMLEDSRQTFDANEELREAKETQRVQNELKRVQAETKRADAEVTRQQKMTEFEQKATQLSNDLDTQVARVDEFVEVNEEKLLGPHDKTDYMGNAHKSVKDANDANVEYILGEVNTVHYEGQHITATDTIERQVRSTILKGKTLVNLAKDNNVVTAIGGLANWYAVTNLSYNLTPNKKYFIKARIIENTINDEYGITLLLRQVQSAGVTQYVSAQPLNKNGYMIVTIDSDKSNIDYISLYANTKAVSGKYIMDNFLITEYQDDMENWDTPYFTEMTSVRMPVLTTMGKNLFDGEIEIGSLNATTGETTSRTDRKRSKNYIRVVSGGRYCYSENTSLIGTNILEYDKNKKFIKTISIKQGVAFQLSDDTEYIKFFNEHILTNVDAYNVQIEESPTSTEYEPFKSNILSTPSDLVLRGIGDVKDTLDLNTGTLTQRTTYGVFDGSEGWISLNTKKENTFYASLAMENIKKSSTKIITNLVTPNVDIFNNDVECCRVGSDGKFYIRLLKSRLSTLTVDGFKQWLTQNNIHYAIELEQEVVKTVDLSGQKVYSYDGTTHYSCSAAEGSLIPTLSIDVPTNLSALVSRQRNTINQLQSENEQLKEGIIEIDHQREEGDVKLLGYDLDLDFRLLEIECTLDLPMLFSTKNKKGANDMNTYKTAKTLILAGNYEREDMEYKLSVYLKRGRLTQEEYNELISLMDARELVE